METPISALPGYQPRMAFDADPNDESAIVKGATWDSLKASIVFLETIRDLAKNLAQIVAHETGHGPGLREDHWELSLMDQPIQTAPGENVIRFREVTILRFRKTSSWYGPLVR